MTEIKVTGHRTPRQPGAVVGDIKPEVQLSPADIQSYGVSTLTELISELSPETRSDRGRGASTPVVLLNGRRVSSFNEIQNIPTEAILRVDVLPEEVSLKYGYIADQRVVNVVLRRRFHAVTGEAIGGAATEGAEVNGQAEADQFRVLRDDRLNLDLKYKADGGITDADRGLNEAASGQPFDLAGNVLSSPPGGQIDPALSALAGRPVTIAGVPVIAARQRPTLADFLPTAGLANTTDTAADRSLAPSTQQLTANAVLARPIFAGIDATFNATLGGSASSSMQGLPGLGLTVPSSDPFSPFGAPVLVDRYAASQGALVQTVQGWTAHLGTTLNRDLDDWRLSLTSAYDFSDSITLTDTGLNPAPLQALLDQGAASFNPFGALSPALLGGFEQSKARAISNSGNVQLLANGPLLKVPAGDLYVSVKLGDTVSQQSSTSLRAAAFQSLDLSRNDGSAQLNLDLPLASKSHDVFGFMGELSVNLNSAVDDLSDFGVLPTLGYGVNWTPVPGYNLIVSETHDHAAPSFTQLGGAVVATPGVRIFDYATGQTVDVTQISGGDRQLVADNRHVMKIGVTLKPWPAENFTFTANYIKSHIDNPIETFPAASAAIEAAFPDRFIRNAEGELTEEDDRPVNFASQDHTELRWGFNYSRPVGKPPPPSPEWRAALARRRAGEQGGADGAPGSGSAGGQGGGRAGEGGHRGAGGGGGGFGGGRGAFAPPAPGRFQIAIYHTVIFKDQFLVRPGGPVLDLLGGAAAGSAGGQYQHEIEAQLGYTLNGYGLRLSADWKSATVVRGGASGSTGDLDFSDIGTVNLRLWDNFAQQRDMVKRYPFLRGVRVTFNAVNLFDQRIQVRDTAGPTPLVYQPAYLDPVGRTVSLSIRKLLY